MLLTYGLLGLAIAAVWLPPLNVGRHAVPLWCVVYLAAVAAGLAAHILAPTALGSLALLLASAWLSRTTKSKVIAAVFTCVAVLVALGLSLHVAPGFNNPVVFANTKLGPDALPFTQYANFDKGSAGLVLLAAYAPRLRPLRVPVLQLATIMAVTAIVLFAFACAAGQVRPDLKLPANAATFLTVNLFFTVIAEEAFFRGLLQERLSGVTFTAWPLPSTGQPAARRSQPLRHVIVVVASALLFGAAHATGGVVMALMATIAGFGYAIVYDRARSIEWALLAHFAVNAAHFFGFSYPALAQ